VTRARSPAPAVSFCLTGGALSLVQAQGPFPLLLAERFVPGAGWLEAAMLAAYAAFLTSRMLEPRRSALWRRRLWRLFSLAFFTQLALGLAGCEQFLMTGDLHVPVPAVIAAGPIYRAERFFMPLLFGATVILAGPAWCSFLCYMGAWDDAAATRKRHATFLPRWRHPLRAAILALVIGAAAALRAVGASTLMATSLAVAFGVLGVAVMILFSPRSGVMAHCTVYCPIGLAANILGRVNPFRLRIDASCTRCGACGAICRYAALPAEALERGRPDLACTLCGDCVGACSSTSISFTVGGIGVRWARTAFLVLAVSLHAVFLGVARI
jgi:polyferredoxin